MSTIFKRSAAVVLAAAVALSATACAKTETEVEAAAIKVYASKPAISAIQQRACFTGKVMPDDSVSVYGKSEGTVLKTYVEVGERVEKDQLLYELDPKDYEISLEQSRLAYEQALNDVESAENGSGDALAELKYKSDIDTARNAYESTRAALELKVEDDFNMSDYKKARKKYTDAKKAWEKEPTTETYDAMVAAERDYSSELDQYGNRTQYNVFYTQFESAYDAYENALEQYDIYKSAKKGENLQTFDISRQQAKLKYDSMLQKMDNLKVYAPIGGVVEAKNVSENDIYLSSMAGYVVSNKDIMVVNFAVSGEVAAEMSVGDAVTVENGNKSYKAEVTEIGTIVNSASGLFPIKARFTEKANILSGVTVKLTAITAKSDKSIIISVDAIYYDDGNTYVYTVKDGVAVKTPVTIGIISEGSAEVIDGLNASDVVVTSWSPELNDGVAVEISEEV